MKKIRRSLLPAIALATLAAGLTGMGLRPSLYHQRELAKAYTYSGQFERAKQKWVLLTQMDPKAREDLAAFLFERGDYAGAEQAYRQTLLDLPEPLRAGSPLLPWLARSQADQAHWEDCLKTLDAMSPGLVEAPMLRLRAEALQTLGRQDEAAQAWESALKASRNEPGASLLRFEAAAFLDGRGDTSQAERYYKAAYRLDNSYSGVHQLLADLYQRTGQMKAAMGRLERARMVDPRSASARQDLRKLVKSQPWLVDQENKAEDAQDRRRVARANLSVTPLAGTEGAPTIRVGLLVHASGFTFKTGCPMAIYDLSDTEPACVLAELPADEAFDVSRERRHWLIATHGDGDEIFRFNQPIRLAPRSLSATVRLFDVVFGEGYFFGGTEDRSYRGSLEILPRGREGLNLLNRVSLEEYLLGVVPSEIDSSWPAAALRAQAIVARTDAWTKFNRHSADGFDVCSEVHCAFYRGASRERASTTQAVEETRGQVLVKPSNHRLVATFYMNSCGGHTQTDAEAWERPTAPGNTDSVILETGSGDMDEEGTKQWRFPLAPQALLDWLSLTAPAYCYYPGEQVSNFRWVKRYSAAELSDYVNRQFNVGDLVSVEPIQRASSGFVRSIRFTGCEGVAEAASDRIRRAIKGIKSNLFYVETRRDARGMPVEFLFYGGGWGHGVGFCQVGAAGRASHGQDANQILKAYFPNAILDKRY